VIGKSVEGIIFKQDTMPQPITPPVGLFGKLPSHPDFVRMNAGAPLARSLDVWMQEGLSQMRVLIGETWEAAFDSAPPLYFAYRDKDPSEALVGVCRPGRDQTGRRYPFSIFAHFHLGRGGGAFHALPAGCARFLKAARRFALVDCADGIDNQRAASIINLSSILPQNLVEFRSSLDRYLNDITMESFFRGLYPDFHDHRKYLVMKNLFTALAPRRGQDPMRLGFTLQLPTTGDFDAVLAQSAIWYLLCQAVLGEGSLTQSVMFWYADDTEARGCYMFFHPPAPASLTYLMAPHTDNGKLWKLETLGANKAEEARAQLGGQLAAAIDTPHNTMRDFIKALGA